jgi:lysylphosphatidylglycerol synthetase-like protein (DUF2156 family)
VTVPTGGRVFVLSDLLLGPVADPTTEATSGELARLLDGIEGPAVVVLAGDTFDLTGGTNPRPAKALTAHPVLVGAMVRFLEHPDHRLMVLAGERDRAIIDDTDLRSEVERRLGAMVADVVDLEIATGCGGERVRVEHGDHLDDGTTLAGVNARARHHALTLAADGYDGLVTAHTRAAELTDLGSCWYANCGCANRIVQPRGHRFGRDDVPVELRQISWLELEAGAKLHVRLVAGQSPTVEAPLHQRLTCRAPRVAVPVRPATVATLTEGQTWPPEHLADATRWPRRIGAAGLALVGVVNVLSVLTPPVRARFALLHHAFPFAIPELAATTVAASGVALCLLAVALRRGQRRAWVASLVLLGASVVGHVTKGLDVEEAAVAAAVLAFLVVHRSAFQGRGGARDVWPRLGLLAAIVAGAAVTSVVTFVVVAGVPLHVALPAVVGRLVGIPEVVLPSRADEFDPMLAVIGLGSIGAAVWTLLRPSRGAPADDDVEAWRLVRTQASDTLDYFALRDDKHRFIWGQTVVAYAVHCGTAVVSPDPIGPPDERAATWTAFRQHAAAHGWHVAVLGAGVDWLPTYRAAGMTAVYVGDEGVVEVRRFSLEGGRHKSLRQAVNRVARAGYTVTFHDPARLTPAEAEQLRAVMSQSRRGDVERGFSMTLSRLFDPRDRGLLLAVVRSPDGAPVAFCQFVPAPGIDGFSLDLMRRTRGEHPNGLTDFLVVKTIEHLRSEGRRGLGLNFATMRAVLAGERSDSVTTRLGRRVLLRLSEDMQIESLWRFSAKFDPAWRPRYVVLEARELALGTGLAIARAESFWELPVVGRFFRPTTATA